jgi:hypothetical protein
MFTDLCRGGGIRTHGPSLPNETHPVQRVHVSEFGTVFVRQIVQVFHRGARSPPDSVTCR